MTIAVIVSPEAEAQIREIDSWWRENRKAAPDLFLQELADATTTLETMPSAGTACTAAEHE
jgi:plasmid stabilization system protein ParE